MASNQESFERAKKVLVGGVNSPVRAFKAVGGAPVFMKSGKGPHLFDVAGKRYIDYLGAWGPMILGHAHPDVVEAIRKAAEGSFSFGTPSDAEAELAERVIDRFPSIERLRLVNSGTEAVMGAVRAARGFTGRDKVLKFAGCYHGHADYLLVKAGSGATTLGIPDSAGVPAAFAGETLTARYNDLGDVDRLLDEHGRKLAAVILEPVVGNMGVVPPAPGFLEGLRERCSRVGALLIFDEVMTGFRVARGGAQELYKVKPDLTTLGKIIGGGLPVGAYGGRADVMEKVAPMGPVYQAGTNSGNPISMTAGIATLRNLTPTLYENLEVRSKRLGEGLAGIFGETAVVQRVGSMATLFILKPGVTDRAIRNYDDAEKVDRDRFGRFFRHLLENGIHFPPSAFEAFFVSAAHAEAEIDWTIEAARSFSG